MDWSVGDGGAVLKKLALLSLFVTACSVERGESDWEPQELADLGVDSENSEFALGEGPGAGTMDGTWLQVHEGSTCVLNDEQLTHAWYLVEIEQAGRSLRETRTICRVDLSPVLGLRVLIPEATRDAIEFIEVDRGFVSDLRSGGTYTSSLELALWGVELEDPLSEELPDDGEDPRVVDADEDENPGVTFAIDASSCLRFAGQRQAIRYSGTFDAPNSISGTSANITDVEAYGSTEVLCGIAPPINSNDAHSKFRMVRIDGLGGAPNLDENEDGQITCDEASVAFLEVIERREADRERCKRD